jgi:hypothetical protein
VAYHNLPSIDTSGPPISRVERGREFDSDLNVYVPEKVATESMCDRVVGVALGENFMVVLGEGDGDGSSKELDDDDDDYFTVSAAAAAADYAADSKHAYSDDDGVDSKSQFKTTSHTASSSSSSSSLPPDVNQMFSWCRNNRQREVTAAINAGFDVNSTDSYGNTMLTVAAQNGILWLAKLVVRKGANKNAQNKSGNTALHYCMYYKHEEFQKWLLADGADDVIANLEGLTCWEGLRRDELDNL